MHGLGLQLTGFFFFFSFLRRAICKEHTSPALPHHPPWRSSSPICTFLTSERIIVSHHRPFFFSLLLLAVCCCPRSSSRACEPTYVCVCACAPGREPEKACLLLPVGGDCAQCHGKLGEKLNEAPIMRCLAAPHDPAAAAAAGKHERIGRLRQRETKLFIINSRQTYTCS